MRRVINLDYPNRDVRIQTIYQSGFRDPTRVSLDTQIERLIHSRDRIGRRLVKAAKLGDTAKVMKLSLILADTQGKVQLLHSRLNPKEEAL